MPFIKRSATIVITKIGITPSNCASRAEPLIPMLIYLPKPPPPKYAASAAAVKVLITARRMPPKITGKAKGNCIFKKALRADIPMAEAVSRYSLSTIANPARELMIIKYKAYNVKAITETEIP